MPAALTMLATDALGVLAQNTGKVGRLIAFWDICRARDLAWDFANHLRGRAQINCTSVLSLREHGVVPIAMKDFWC
jgi:hypothetical protein